MDDADKTLFNEGLHRSAIKAVTKLMSPPAPSALKLSIISKAWSAEYQEQEQQEHELGFCDSRVPHGSHVCFFYTNENERDELVFEYVKAGTENSERCVCAIHYEKPLTWINSLIDNDFNMTSALGNEHIDLREGDQFFFEDQEFIPREAVSKLDLETRRSTQKGFNSTRLLLDISWANQQPETFDAILEYEQLVNATYYPNNPAVGMCLYDLKTLPDAFADQLISLHPYFIYKSSFKRNPSFIAN